MTSIRSSKLFTCVLVYRLKVHVLLCVLRFIYGLIIALVREVIFKHSLLPLKCVISYKITSWLLLSVLGVSFADSVWFLLLSVGLSWVDFLRLWFWREQRISFIKLFSFMVYGGNSVISSSTLKEELTIFNQFQERKEVRGAVMLRCTAFYSYPWSSVVFWVYFLIHGRKL